MTRADPRKLYYAVQFTSAAATGWVVFDLFLVRELRLSPLQLILMGTAMEATIFVSEIPTGVVADTYSRRLSWILGTLGMGAATVGVGVSSTPWHVIGLWGAWGLAYTFTSGAWEAWIADEVGPQNVGSLFLRGKRVAYAGAFAGLALWVAIGAWSLRAAVIGGGALQLALGAVCIFVMPETGFRRAVRAERSLRRTTADGIRFVRSQTLVLLLVATELFAGFGAEAFDRLTEAHVIRDVGMPTGINPVYAFAAVSTVSLAFGFFVVARVIQRVDRGGTPVVARMLVLFTLATIVAQIGFALAGSFALVMVVFLAAVVTRSLLAPLYTTWLNRQVTDSSVRATVLSISGQADAIGEATGGPVLGAIGNGFGIPAALVTGALLLLPALGLYARALRHDGHEPELDELPQAAETLA